MKIKLILLLTENLYTYIYLNIVPYHLFDNLCRTECDWMHFETTFARSKTFSLLNLYQNNEKKKGMKTCFACRR